MQAARGSEIELIGVAGRADLSAHQEFIEAFGVGALEHVYDESGDFWGSFGVTSQPAWAFIDDSGSVEVMLGRLGVDGLNERIDALLAA